MNMITLTNNPKDYDLPFPDWYENQKQMCERAVNLDKGEILILEAPTGCHRAGQLILMWDGSTKPVEEIKVGNILMGPDSKPRHVTELVNGRGAMYEITPVKGESFVVNENHILSLVRTGHKQPEQRKDCRWGEITDVQLRDYLDWSKTQKYIHKLLRASSIDFPYQYQLEIDPYFLGALLGDGSVGATIGITTQDDEIVQEFYKQAELKNLHVRIDRKPNNSAASYYFATRSNSTHYFAYYLENMGLRGTTSGNKFIPQKYRTASVQDRLELLAGLMDTDGYLGGCCFDYVSKSQRLARDVAFVARSLGMAAYVRECQKSDQYGHVGTYHRVSISGDTHLIPCRLLYKRASPRKQIKSVLRTGFSCKQLGIEEYFGFSLGSSDGRFLLGDFTVTHNSGKSACPVLTSHFRRGSTVCMGTRDLQIQYRDTFSDVAIVWGQSHYPCVHPGVISEYREAYDESPTRADCTYRKPKDCDYHHDCPYELSKTLALQARAKVSNYAYAYYTKWWRLYTNDLFCDEAHKLPDVLSSLISVEIAERTRSWFGLPEFPFVSGGTKFAYNSIKSWSEAAVTSLGEIHTQDLKKRKRIRQMTLKLRELFTALSIAQPGDWYVASGQALGKLVAQPIIPGKFAKRILDEHARSITLMSATIGDPEVLARELGVQQYSWLTLPHIFPKEHRPVLFYKDAPRINSRSGSDIYNTQADLIAKILRSHSGHKGIIHTVSWKHTKTLARLLTKRGLGSRLYIPEGERIQSINGFKQSDGDRVAISPSWHEGLNFQDDLARFCVIAKVPYLSLGDPVVKLRLQAKGGNAWYRWKAALGVVQAAGRIVRHRDDWGVTHIVDGEWSRVASKAPAWFEVDEV